MSFLSFRDDIIIDLSHEMARCYITSHTLFKWRLSTGYVFARLQLGEHTMKIFEDLKKVVGVKVASYSTVRTWHCEFESKKSGNKTDRSNGRPDCRSNKSTVAAAAKLVKEDPQICV